ncbi:MAG: glycosyltransferase [Trueperaceae bacterium]|nr:glycosyltransferase [Trueperaceae bacterium]
MQPKIDILLPVYNGLKDLKLCIDSVFKAVNRIDWHLHILHDASTDGAVAEYLVTLESEARVSIHHNEKNLGFVKTVNKGFKLSSGDVVLLNSDTLVYDGWLDRLVAHGYRHENVATITPLSNNATIASFPEFLSDKNTRLGLSGQELDALCYQANKGAVVEVPTGVGFCMFISRGALNQVGYFDEDTFGRGYGEENDFCMRAGNEGFRNLLACDVYVSHTGGVSFAEEKEALIVEAIKQLNRIHPGYDRKIHKFIVLDPVREYRLKVLLKLSQMDKRPPVLHICHAFGGGTLQNIREIAQYFEKDSIHWVLRALEGDIVRLEWATAPSTYVDIDTEKDKVFFWEILKYIGISRIHVHHLAGLPQEVMAFIREAGLEYDVTLHDYYFINANPTLVNTKGEISSPLSAEGLTSWQKEKHEFLQGAQRIFCPSQRAREIYEAYYPGITFQTISYLEAIQAYPYPDVSKASNHKGIKVAVLGALNPEKGADLFVRVAKLLTKNQEFDFSLLGYAYKRLPKMIKVWGQYDNLMLESLIEEENPDIIWFPALWEETYSYTLSGALKSGRPILAPNLGAFPERLANRPLTKLYEPYQDVEAIAKTIEVFAAEVKKVESAAIWLEQPKPDPFNREHYLSASFNRLEPVISEAEILEGLAYRLKLRLSLKEKALGTLLNLKRYALVRLLLQLLPLRHKLRVVQFFTKKSLLDLERQLIN